MKLKQWLDANVLPYIAIIILGVILAATESTYLARVEEQNLFLHTPLFFKQCMVVPGGLLSWMGAFLTQLLHIPALGVAVLCLMWMLLVCLIGKAFRINGPWLVVALIPVAMLLVANTCLGYWIYYLKLRGFFFTATLGTIMSVAAVWAYRAMPPVARTPFVVLAVGALYPLTGCYALLTAALIAVMSWRVKNKAWAGIDTLLAIVTAVAVPLICYHTIYHETNIVHIYRVALPMFQMRQQSYPAYYIPYIIIACSLLGMAAFGKASNGSKIGWKQWVLVTVIAVFVAAGWYKDANFHHEMAMRRCVDKTDWQGVLSIAKNASGEPTRDMWMMKNLALARTGKLGEEMYDYPNGACRANASFGTRMVQWDGKMLYFNFGLPNYCYRWCMEDGVEYGWSVDKMKLMVKCSLVNGEFSAAQKIISLLKKTLFHKKWAKKYEGYVHNPRLIAEDAELLPVLRLMQHDNYLSGDNAAVEHFLIEHFAGTDAQDPILQELTLTAAMQTRNPNLFWMRFYQYTQTHKDQHIPKLYQQAACLFGGMDGKLDINSMPFDPSVVQECKEFMDYFKKCHDEGLDMEQTKNLMKNKYWNTYYFDYFFNNYQEEPY